MRILRPIVQALMLAMFDAKAHLRSRSAVRTELVVIITRGGMKADFNSFFMSRCAARVSLRRWIKTSSTKPF